MSQDTTTRRSFLKVGALIAAPLAVVPAAAVAGDGSVARLRQLEDEAALRALHRQFVRGINGGDGVASLFADSAQAGAIAEVRGIAADHAGDEDVIRIAADGRSAAGRFPCAVEVETELAQDCTLAQMAHAQGGGRVRHTERRVVEADYVRAENGWAIARLEFAAA